MLRGFHRTNVDYWIARVCLDTCFAVSTGEAVSRFTVMVQSQQQQKQDETPPRFFFLIR